MYICRITKINDMKIKKELKANEVNYIESFAMFSGNVMDLKETKIDIFSDSREEVEQIQRIICNANQIIANLTELSNYKDGYENSSTCQRMRELAQNTLKLV